MAQADEAAAVVPLDSDECGCAICLALIVQPNVNVCGHSLCFWCTFQTMAGNAGSHCAICRRQFSALPGECKMLTRFVSEAFPTEYTHRRRDFARLNRGAVGKRGGGARPKRSNRPAVPAHSTTTTTSTTATTTTTTTTIVTTAAASDVNEEVEEEEEEEDDDDDDDLDNEDDLNDDEEEELTEQEQQQRQASESKRQVALVREHLGCRACGVCPPYKPVVGTCGCILCFYCVHSPTSAYANPGTCPSCRLPLATGTFQVSLLLQTIYRRLLPAEYAAAAAANAERDRHFAAAGTAAAAPTTTSSTNGTATGDANASSGGSSSGGFTAPMDKIDAFLSTFLPSKLRHVGAGCDCCGVMPIIGRRYKCLDCTVAIGFDMCGRCYLARDTVDVQGRFNQAHLPTHRLEEVVVDIKVLIGHIVAFCPPPLFGNEDVLAQWFKHNTPADGTDADGEAAPLRVTFGKLLQERKEAK